MRRFRFRIGSLSVLIAFLGVGFAALREASDIWDSIVLTLAIGVLFVSLLLAIHRRVDRRAFWIAFALFGWGYLGLTALPSVEPRLLTTWALSYLDSRIRGRPARPYADVLLTSPVTGYQGYQVPPTIDFSAQVWSPTTGKSLWTGAGPTENFVWIGHSLLALILAWLGGSLSRRLHLRSREADPAFSSVEVGGIE